ncbi:MAG: hypothetical protein ACFFG0_03380 [Candidatus Thorarchaeota archaeon]
MAKNIKIPEGFVLDEPKQAKIPEGFVLDQPEQPQGRLEKIGGFLKEAFTGAGPVSLPGQRALLGAEAEAARGAQDIIGKGIGLAGKGISALTPDIIEEPIKKTIKNLGIRALENPIVQTGLKAIQGGMDLYSDFKQKYPEQAQILEDVGAVASVLPFAGPASKFVGKVATPIGKTAKFAGKAVIGKGIVAPAKFTFGTAPIGIARAVKGATPVQILRERINPQQAKMLLRKLIKSGDDSVALLPDIGGEEIRGLTRAAGRIPGGAKEIVSTKLKIRSASANKRVNKALNNFLSDQEFFGSLDDVIANRTKASAPFYEEAAGKIVPKKSLTKFLNDQRFKSALKKAQREFNLDPKLAPNAVESLDAVKKVWDDTIGSAYKAGKNQKARAFREFKNDMLKVIDKEVPEYATARSIFSDYSQLKSAQELGLNFKKYSPVQLRKQLAGFTDGEKSAFRVGVKENLRKIVDQTSEGADPAKRIFGNPEIKNSLKAIFKKEDFHKFQRKMIEEIRGAETKFNVLGGSRTDYNIVDLGKGINQAKSIAKDPRFSNIIDKVSEKFVTPLIDRFQGLDPQSAKALAQVLTDKKKSIEVLKELAKEKKKFIF